MKKGYALLVAMSYESNCRYLDSAYPSADRVYHSFKNKKRNSFFPDWVFHENKPIDAISSNALKECISDAADEANQSGKDLLMLYIIGHGYGAEGEEIFILAEDSIWDRKSIATNGISIADIIDIISSNKFKKNVILIFDVCRNQELEKIASRENLHQMLKNKSKAFDSLLLVSSTTHGSVALGGSKEINQSPYSLALSKFIENDSYLAHSRTGIKNIFKEILTQIFNDYEGKLRTKEISAYSYSVDGKNYTFFAIPLNIELSGIKRKVIERDKRSFRHDYYLSEFDEVWTPKLKTIDQEDISFKSVIYDSRSVIITAQSGYGKTIAGKYLSVIANEHQKNNLWIYLNILNLNKYSYNDLFRVLYANISTWRYDIDEVIGHEAINSFVKEHPLVVILDYIDDFQNEEVLKKLINDLGNLNIRIIVLCQHDKVENIKRYISHTTTLVLNLQPYSINNLTDIDLSRRVDLAEKLNLEGDPISLHNIKFFLKKNNRYPKSISEIDHFLFQEIVEVICKYKSEFESIEFSPRYELLANKKLFKNSKVCTYVLFLISKITFSLHKEDHSFSFEEKDLKRVLLQEHPESDIERLLSVLLKVLTETKTIRQDSGRNTVIRYSHNTNIYRLVALYFYYYYKEVNELIKLSSDIKWAFIVAKYFSIFDNNEGAFVKLCKSNSFCGAQAIQLGYKFTKNTLNIAVEELLKNSSIWTRNRAAATLGILPTIVQYRLFELFHKLSYEEQNTAVLSLSYQPSIESVNMLKNIYISLLQKQSTEKNLYLRRRTLDSLKGKLDINFIIDNKIQDQVDEREWGRILRAISNINHSGYDFNFLFMSTSEICKSDLSKELLNNTYLEKLNLIDHSSITDSEYVKRIIVTVKKALAFGQKWHKCIAVLFLEELYPYNPDYYLEISNLLINSFFKEENQHVKGDIAYVYGLFSTTKGMEQLIREYAKLSKLENSNNDLMNDIALGISRAINLNKDYEEILLKFGLEHIYKKA